MALVTTENVGEVMLIGDVALSVVRVKGGGRVRVAVSAGQEHVIVRSDIVTKTLEEAGWKSVDAFNWERDGTTKSVQEAYKCAKASGRKAS